MYSCKTAICLDGFATNLLELRGSRSGPNWSGISTPLSFSVSVSMRRALDWCNSRRNWRRDLHLRDSVLRESRWKEEKEAKAGVISDIVLIQIYRGL